MNTVGTVLVAGFIGTVVLTTMLRSASQLGWTRMDLAFLLGTAMTDHRQKAQALGYFVHFVLGLAFAFIYAACFWAIGASTWWVGALLGALHALFVSTVLVNVLLPVVHPRMGTSDTAANDVALIEPPGFLMLNYGRNTFFVTLAAHVAFGAIVGAMMS